MRARLRIVAAALLISGCGPSVGGSAIATESPIATSSVGSVLSSSSSPGASARQSETPSLITSPAPLAIVTLENPGLKLQLPRAWRALSSADLRDQIEQSASGASPASKAVYEDLLRQVDAGEIRGGGIGPSGFDGWQGTMLIAVTPAESIDEQIERVRAQQTAFGLPSSTQRRTVTLPIGEAVRIMDTADPPRDTVGQAVAARGIAYYIDLGDGRIFWMTATGPQDSPTFEAMIDASMATFSRC